VQSNASGLLAFGIAQLESGNPTAMILGAVAVGIVGIGAIAFTVKYFRNGGTVGGFLNKVKEQKGAITQLANALPLSEAQRAQLKSAEAKATSAVQSAQATQASVLQALPPSVGAKVLEKEHQIRDQAMTYAPVPVEQTHVPVSVPEKSGHHEQPSVLQTVVQTVTEQVAPPSSLQTPAPSQTPNVTHIAIAPEDLEAVRAFLAQKSTS
jgi:hypothetical protein